MTDSIIDENIKAYLIACLVSGIHVETESAEFMCGLVGYMNSLPERLYWAVGDEDGIILHDKLDNPVLSLLHDGSILKFSMLDNDEFLGSTIHREAGLMLLNILGYIRELGLDCEPECARRITTVISPQETEIAEDWSL